MSLINQVLNDLEKRGADVGDITGVVRAIPERSNGFQKTILLGVVLVFLAVLAGAVWKWWPGAATVGTQTLVSAPTPHSAPIAIPQPTAQSMVAAIAPVMAESAVAALQLSLELADNPLPAAPPSQPQPIKPKTATMQPPQPRTPMKQVKPQQQAADEYNHAVMLVQQGRHEEALPHLDAALRLNPMLEQARQMLAGLLLESKRNIEAEGVLQRGLKHNVKHAGFAMLLARLQIERGDIAQALQTLKNTLPYAEQQADYRAFMAALLQRKGNHTEAIAHYQAALQRVPNSALWLMGMGISLQALQRNDDARAAFKTAAQLHTLTPELQSFVERRLKEL